MSDVAAGDWVTILTRLNSVFLTSNRWRSKLPSEALTTGWCGSPPATESEILTAEERLGVRLPPSYRSFLAVSNGWLPFSSFIERLLPVREIERLRSADSEDLAMIQEYYREDDISDDAYLDYKTPKHSVALRHRYYPDCILVSKGRVGGELVLLNPNVASDDDEWETIFFANWVPGNVRYRSFRDFVEESVAEEEAIQGARRNR